MFYNRKLYNIYCIQNMTKLFEIKVKLSENQKKNSSDAYRKRETIVIRLTNDSLSGGDTLYVPATVKKRLERRKVWISSFPRETSENKSAEVY